jgi:hypothetical protein
VLDDEELVFEAVRARIAAGEHLDSMLGLPGVDVEGGGAFQHAPDGRLQRIHWRWEPGFRAARDSGRIPPLPPLTPATPEALRVVEDAAGAALPALFRRCYLELGNGGFGPGYGLLPAPEGVGPEPGTLLGDRFSERRERLVNGSLLLICHWGCGIASFIDLRDPAGPMWAIDPNGTPSEALFQEDLTFTQWLGSWAESALEQPAAERTAQQDAATTAYDDPWGDSLHDPWRDSLHDPWRDSLHDPWHADRHADRAENR